MDEMRRFYPVINAGEAVSNEIQCAGGDLVCVMVPAGWTAADLTLLGSVDGDVYFDVHAQDGTEIVLNAGPSRYISVSEYSSLGDLISFKLRSGTSAVPVVQTAEIKLTVVME